MQIFTEEFLKLVQTTVEAEIKKEGRCTNKQLSILLDLESDDEPVVARAVKLSCPDLIPQKGPKGGWQKPKTKKK